jgi:single-strand DNA-binding protein
MEEVTFIDIDAWGKQAELIAQYLRKGNPLFVEGRLKLDQWDDKNSGQKVSKLRVVMENFQFIGGRAEGGGGVPPAAAPARQSRPQPSSTASSTPSESDGPPPDDDVPF